MKTSIYKYLLALLGFTILLPALAYAEDSASVDASTTVNVSSSADMPPQPPLPADMPTTPPPSIREKIRADYEARMDAAKTNLKANQDFRTNLLEERQKMASSTEGERADIRDNRIQQVGDIRAEGSAEMKDATTSADRHEIRNGTLLSVFAARKDALVKQLQLSLSNLAQIRTRIVSRLEKAEGDGASTTEARALLAVADTKIAVAGDAVAVVAAYTPAASTTAQADASTTVDLGKPREIGAAAIKAVNDAREALGAIVRELARILKVSLTASTTASTE